MIYLAHKPFKIRLVHPPLFFFGSSKLYFNPHNRKYTYRTTYLILSVIGATIFPVKWAYTTVRSEYNIQYDSHHINDTSLQAEVETRSHRSVDDSSIMSSGRLPEEFNAKYINTPVLFDNILELKREEPLYPWYKTNEYNSSANLLQAAQELDTWETQKYTHLNMTETNYIKEAIHQYELKTDAVMAKANSPLFENEVDVNILKNISDKMPPYRSNLYYPVVVSKADIPTLTNKVFTFEPYFITPGHPLQTSTKFATLTENLQQGEEVILLEINTKMHINTPISSFQDEPGNIDFLVVAKDKYYQVVNQQKYEFGLYQNKITLAEVDPPLLSKREAVQAIAHHRVEECQLR